MSGVQTGRARSFQCAESTDILLDHFALGETGMFHADARKGQAARQIAEIERDSKPFGAGLLPKNLELNLRRSIARVEGNHPTEFSRIETVRRSCSDRKDLSAERTSNGC